MSVLRKKDDIILDVTDNKVGGDVVVGESIKVDGQHYVVDTVGPRGIDNHDIFGDGSSVATYQLNSDVQDLGGTYHGAPTAITYEAAKYDNGARFNGTTSDVVVAVPAPAGGVGSVSFWASKSVAQDSAFIGGADYAFRTNAANLIYVYGTSTFATFTGGGVFINDVLNHVVVLFDGADARVFINNVEQTITGGPVGGMQAITRLGERDNNTLKLAGRLDQVRIFNKVLSAGEIASLYEEHLVYGQVLTTTPTLPVTITNASTEYKTKLTVTDNVPDVSQLFIGDDILVDGADYNVTAISYPQDTRNVYDVFGDSSSFAMWKFENTDDDEGGTFTGTSTAISYNASGKFGTSAVFTGATTPSRIQVSPACYPPTGGSSISFWVKINAVHDLGYIIGGAPSHVVRAHSTLWVIAAGVAVFSTTENMCPALDTWYHIVITDNGTNTVKGYRDGVEFTNTSGYYWLSSLLIDNIGYNVDGPTINSLDGELDQFRIFSKELTQADVNLLFTETVPASVTTTPVLPGTVTDVHIKRMTAIGGNKEPQQEVLGFRNIYTESSHPDVMTASDVTNVTINHVVANGDDVYTRNLGNSIDTVTVASVIDNLNGTWSFAHGQAYTPSEVYIVDNVNLTFSDDSYTTITTPTKGAPTLELVQTIDALDILGDGSCSQPIH